MRYTQAVPYRAEVPWGRLFTPLRVSPSAVSLIKYTNGTATVTVSVHRLPRALQAGPGTRFSLVSIYLVVIAFGQLFEAGTGAPPAPHVRFASGISLEA